MITLALLAVLWTGGEAQRAREIPAAPLGDVMRFAWEDSEGRSVMHYRLARAGRGLRYLDLGRDTRRGRSYRWQTETTTSQSDLALP